MRLLLVCVRKHARLLVVWRPESQSETGGSERALPVVLQLFG